MIQKVVHIDTVGEITISRNRRSKKLRLVVKPDKKVVVTIPFYSSFRDAVTFAQNNSDWILKQQKKYETVLVKYSIGSKIETKFHNLSVLSGSDIIKATKKGNNVNIFIPSEKDPDAQDFIREVLIKIYRIEAKQYLVERLALLAHRFGFRYGRITVRNNRRNWGSCSSKNNISMNLQVMRLPYELIDYILLHELAHTVEKNHGTRFWEILDRVTGNRAKELQKKVKQYSPYLF